MNLKKGVEAQRTRSLQRSRGEACLTQGVVAKTPLFLVFSFASFAVKSSF